MSLSAAIFRRGGPKKELFSDAGAISAKDGNAQDAADRQQLEQELAQILEVLQAPKAGWGMRHAMGACCHLRPCTAQAIYAWWCHTVNGYHARRFGRLGVALSCNLAAICLVPLLAQPWSNVALPPFPATGVTCQQPSGGLP